jgi:hypothetical protein
MKAFSDQDVRQIKTRHFQQFMNTVAVKRPDLSPSTRNGLSATFRNVLKGASDDGVIDRVPSTPRTPHSDNPRPFFRFYPLVPKSHYLASCRRRAVCGDWMVEIVGLKLVTHHPVIEPVSRPRVKRLSYLSAVSRTLCQHRHSRRYSVSTSRLSSKARPLHQSRQSRSCQPRQQR